MGWQSGGSAYFAGLTGGESKARGPSARLRCVLSAKARASNWNCDTSGGGVAAENPLAARVWPGPGSGLVRTAPNAHTVQQESRWNRHVATLDLFRRFFGATVGEQERREKPRVNAREGTRVLIVDDSPTIVALLRKFLQQSGYLTLEAGDAEKGVEIALKERPDLIFLDIVLPGMNGFAALRQLRRDPATREIPIVMISGNEQATEQFYAQRIGADDFMKKPFSRSEVFVRIERLLDADRVPKRPAPSPTH
jgi:CheY-like chemotaxis protein